MILFSTTTTRHLAANIAMRSGACTIKQFRDGELFVRIDEDVRNKSVWVLAATQAPAEHLLELFFLLDALHRGGAIINLFITYFAYARQGTATPEQACSAQVIGMILQQFTIAHTYILHPHSALLHEYLPFKAVQDIEYFCVQARAYDAIAAPDKGAQALAREIAHKCGKELILLTKRRLDQDNVEIVAVDGVVEDKKIMLIDDIISTGRTLVEAAYALQKLGAQTVAAVATHGLFAADARHIIEESPLLSVTVTNSIEQEARGKIKIVDISSFIERVMQGYMGS
jgi:ribose-phosphate pyrophosphokinase